MMRAESGTQPVVAKPVVSATPTPTVSSSTPATNGTTNGKFHFLNRIGYNGICLVGYLSNTADLQYLFC